MPAASPDSRMSARPTTSASTPPAAVASRSDGTFPTVLQWLVQATPLYHGVALERALMLGEVDGGVLWHVTYLLVMGGAGVIGAARMASDSVLSHD